MTTWRKQVIKQQQLRGTYNASANTAAPNLPTKPKPPIKLPKAIPGDIGRSSVHFTHPNKLVGSLTIETGLDIAQWGYNLNTQVYPTYGGEVVQILSVYISDLQLGGSIATYSQMEAIYSYFATYMQIATQGRNPNPDAGNSAYNMQPINFTYPSRGWDFDIMPMSIPGFYIAEDVVIPHWQVTAHIVDDSINTNPTLTQIKAQITDATIAAGLDSFARLNDEISPDMKDPNTMPFMVFTGNPAQATQNYADYYNSLIQAYAMTNPSSVPGSAPATNATSGTGTTSPTQITNSGHSVPGHNL